MGKATDTITAARRTAIKAWLKNHKHAASAVDSKNFTKLSELRAAVCDLHGVKEKEYKKVSG
jgi:hypothetical protein